MTTTEEFDPETFDWWVAQMMGREPPIYGEMLPMPGFYRSKKPHSDPSKTGKAVAVWYATHDEEGNPYPPDADMLEVRLRVVTDGEFRVLPNLKAAQSWNYVARGACTKEDYNFRVENGHWPDEPKPVTTVDEHGNPLPPMVVSKNRLANLEAHAKAIKITDATSLNWAQTIRGGLLGCKAAAENFLEDANKPHLAGYNAVRQNMNVWNPFIKSVDEASKKVKTTIETYMGAEHRRKIAETEAANRVLAEAAAEQARLAGIAAAAEAGVSNKRLLPGGNAEPMGVETMAPVLPVPQLAMPTVQSQIAGAVGRAASVRAKWEPVFEAGWQDPAFKFFHDNPTLLEFMKRMVISAIKDGTEIPGIRRQEGVNLR